MFALLRFLPKKLLSYLVGKLVFTRFPSPIVQGLIRSFAKRYNAKLEEASCSIETYSSLGDFFIRELKDGLRPIGLAVVSPVDGTLTEQGVVESGRLHQLKGVQYSLESLLRDQALCEHFLGGYYFTVYLAPGDYHHIHSPVDGEIESTRHIRGTLWPVNSWSVSHISGLFCVNERVITEINSQQFGRVLLIMVGATNVGSIALAYDKIVTNQFAEVFVTSGITRKVYTDKIPVKRGEKLASFRMGSTVLLLFEPGRVKPDITDYSSVVRYGMQLASGIHEA